MYESNELVSNDDFDLDIFFNTDLIDEEKRNELTQGDEIEYRILQEDEQLYSIENQTADILNKELSKFITKERTPKKIKQINKWIVRYVELRELYSLFNESNNISGIKTFNHNYKPLKLKLNEFKHNIPYIIPVIKSKLEIYDIKGMCPEVSEDALQYLNKDIDQLVILMILSIISFQNMMNIVKINYQLILILTNITFLILQNLDLIRY